MISHNNDDFTTMVCPTCCQSDFNSTQQPVKLTEAKQHMRIETLNLVTVNASRVPLVSRHEVFLRSLRTSSVGSSSLAMSSTRYDEHQAQPSIQHLPFPSETGFGGQPKYHTTDHPLPRVDLGNTCSPYVHDYFSSSCRYPQNAQRRVSSSYSYKRARAARPVHSSSTATTATNSLGCPSFSIRPRRSPLVEVKIRADMHGARKETVIAGWVHCDDEVMVYTDLSCEDSECDDGCQCFTSGQQQQSLRRHQRILSLDDDNSSLIGAFMFTKRKPFLAGKSGEIHALIPGEPLYIVNHDESYTETESETSYEGDDEESITVDLYEDIGSCHASSRKSLMMDRCSKKG
jgi:hypothetical protein